MLSNKKGRGKMKYTHVIMDHVGGPDVLHMQEDDELEPKTGEVRIEILAWLYLCSRCRFSSTCLYGHYTRAREGIFSKAN
jgi:hypothetical protein